MVGKEYECFKVAAQVMDTQCQSRRETSAVSAVVINMLCGINA